MLTSSAVDAIVGGQRKLAAAAAAAEVRAAAATAAGGDGADALVAGALSPEQEAVEASVVVDVRRAIAEVRSPARSGRRGAS